MKRRQFLYQVLSVSAVAVGTGYATMDMLRRSSDKWTLNDADHAQKAAARALRNAPQTDEAMGSAMPGHTAQVTSSSEATLKHAMPAESIKLQGPGYNTPNHASRSEMTNAHQPPVIAEKPSSKDKAPAGRVADAPVSSAQATPSEPISASASAKPRQDLAEREVEVFDESEAKVEAPEYVAEAEEHSEKVRQKVQHFEYDFSDDIFITDTDYRILVSALERLNRVEAYVGHGNFNVLSFDSMLSYGRYQPRIGQFPQEELDYLEKLFYDDVSQLGFFGERIVANLTHQIKDNEISKIPGTGHYLFKGHSQEFYDKVRAQVGEGLTLTSGIRGIVKQYHLFMAKVVQAEGNLSRASRSLAPPGHSYHAIGDFDVGRVGGGLSNFTSDFAETDEFKRLQDLGFVKIRYTTDNNYGVRYEPWHIRVV